MERCFPKGREVYQASAEVLQGYGAWQPPDEAMAFTRHRAEHVHHDFFDLWSSRVRDLKEFGVGTMMYFSFLWWMAALFTLLAVLVAAPNMAINLAGKYYETGSLELTTLGNFGRVAVSHDHDGPSAGSFSPTATGWQHEAAVSQLLMSDAQRPPATEPMNKQAAIVAASVIDCAGAVVYFIVTPEGLIVLARRRAEDADVHTVTIHDYSLYVRQLPADARAEELTEFFSQWGEVESVEVVRAYGGLLNLVLSRGRLLLKLQSAVAGLRKAAGEHAQVPVSLEKACLDLKDDVEELDHQIKLEEAQGDTRRVVGAFVTFRNEGAKLACLKATPNSWIRQLRSLKREHKFRGRYALWIKEAPEPSDIKYESMEHGMWDRALRAALVAVASYTALGLGFLLISLATTAQVNLARSAGINTAACESSCSLSVDGAFGLADVDRERYAACADTGLTPAGGQCNARDSECYRCYCYTALTSGMLSESSYCSAALELLALQYSGQVGVILAILGINMLLAVTSRRLTLFETHHTRSSEARSLAHKLFLAQFLNSAVSTILANAHLPFLANLFNGSALQGIFFQGIYTDLTPNWYKAVGRSLLISQFVAAVLRIMWLLLRHVTVGLSHRGRAACLTQQELEAALRGPEFLLDYRYGEHLSVIYVSMLLGSGMPIAFASAAFWFVSAYWCDKYELLKLSRRPVVYGADLSNHVMNLLPYAAVWHVAFGVWAFSLFGVAESRLVTPSFSGLVHTVCTGLARVLEATSSVTAEQAAARLLGANAAHLLIALFVLAGVVCLKLTLMLWIRAGRALLNMAGLIADAEDTQQTGAPEFSVAVRTQLLVGQASYSILEQPAYSAAFTRMEGSTEHEVQVQVVLRGASRKRAAVGGGGSDAPELQGPATAVLGGSPRTQSALLRGAAPLGNSNLQPAAVGAAPLGVDDGSWEPPQQQLAAHGSHRSSSHHSSSGSSRADSRGATRESQLAMGGGGVPEGCQAAAAAAAAAGWVQQGPPLAVQQQPEQQQQQLSAAQRFRQARASNQVAPAMDRYLGPRLGYDGGGDDGGG